MKSKFDRFNILWIIMIQWKIIKCRNQWKIEKLSLSGNLFCILPFNFNESCDMSRNAVQILTLTNSLYPCTNSRWLYLFGKKTLGFFRNQWIYWTENNDIYSILYTGLNRITDYKDVPISVFSLVPSCSFSLSMNLVLLKSHTVLNYLSEWNSN